MDKYSQVSLIGRGLFSQVFRATDSNGKVVALKITVPEDEVAPHDSQREIQILRQLKGVKNNHNYRGYVIDLLDSFERHSYELELVMVFPYLPFDLNSVMKNYQKGKFPKGWRNGLPIDRALDIINEIIQALQFIHDQHHIIHRDLKPENILFNSLTGSAVLSDFGISWVAPDNNGREPDNNKITDVGTTVYRAPELLFALGSYSAAIDMWALGCIICRLFSDDGITSPFEPYSADIALLVSHVEALGSPTLETWPEMSCCDSFINMKFNTGIDNDDHDDKFKKLAPLAPRGILYILERLLCFQSTNRWHASELLIELDKFQLTSKNDSVRK